MDWVSAKVYVPVFMDEDSKRKMRNFEMVLKNENYERVFDSMEKIVLPDGITRTSLNVFMEEWVERTMKR